MIQYLNFSILRRCEGNREISKEKKEGPKSLFLIEKFQLFIHYHSHGLHLSVLDHFYHVNTASQSLAKVDGGIQ